MSLQELSVAIPETATQIAVLERAVHEFGERTPSDTFDPKPIVRGQPIALTDSYVEQTFALGALRNDLKRYKHLLREMRAEGRRIIGETSLSLPSNDPENVAIPSLFEDRDDTTWIEAPLGDDLLRSLRRLMRERIGFVTGSTDPAEGQRALGAFTLKEINTTVNEVGQRALPLLENLKRNVDASNRYRLVGKEFFLAYGYSPLVEGPTLMLYAADPGADAKFSGPVVGIPFPGRVPDPMGASSAELLSRVSEWFASGEAINTLDAQLMEIGMNEVKHGAEKWLLKEYEEKKEGAFRIPLDAKSIDELLQVTAKDRGSRFTSATLANLARFQQCSAWSSEHQLLLESAYLGIPIRNEQMQTLATESLSVQKFDEATEAEYFALVETMRSIAAPLAYLSTRLPLVDVKKNPITVAYDPKPITGPELVFSKGTRGKAEEFRIPATAHRESLERFLREVSEK